MANSEKTIKRERIRLRKNQNPQQLDFKKMRKARDVRTEFWSRKRQKKPITAVVEEKAKKVTKAKKEEKAKPKKAEKPELEVIDEEPELEVIDEELEELYDFDDDIDEEDSD
ncbi:MAG: hypothetical protein ACFFEF_05425 [Candidatus Thorarchaeota archaeon]